MRFAVKFTYLAIALSLLIAAPAAAFAGDDEKPVAEDKEKLAPDATAQEKAEAQKTMTISEILKMQAEEPAPIENVPPKKVFNLEDHIYIEIEESLSAEDESSMDVEKTLDLNAKLTQLFELLIDGTSKEDALVNPNVDAEATMKREGEGKAEMKSSVKTKITAVIKDIKPNGNLVISAHNEKEVGENKQTITLTGVVSADAVSATNTVSSSAIADKKLIITGDGPVSDAAKRGFIQKLLDLVWPF